MGSFFVFVFLIICLIIFRVILFVFFKNVDA